MALKTNRTFFLLIILFFFSCHSVSFDQKRTTTSGNISRSDTSFIANTLSQIRNFEIYNPSDVFPLLDSVIRLTEKEKQFKELAIAYFLYGIHCYRQDQYPKAKECFNKAIIIAREHNDTLIWAKSLQELGSLALTLGDDHLCLKLNYEALPLFEKIQDREGIAKVYNILGLYKSGQKDYDSAISYYNRAMTINLEIGNKRGIVHNRGNLAYLYEKTGNLIQAKVIYHDLKTQLIQENDLRNLPVIYANLSSVNRKMGYSDSALFYSKKAVQVCEMTKDTAELTGNAGELAEIFLEHGKLDSARLYMNKAVLCSKAVEDPEIEITALKFLIKIDSLEGKMKDAYSKLARIVILKDSVFTRQYKNHLKVSELKYENDKKKLQIDANLLKIEDERKQKKILFFIFSIIILSIGLFTAIIYSYLVNSRKKQKIISGQLQIKALQLENSLKNDEIQKLKIEKYEASLKLKEREQVSHALALEQKNELLSEIGNKLKSSIQDQGSLNIRELNSILASIKSQITGQNEADLFNQKFNNVHPEFYNRLMKSHPGLSHSELKFCAYLRLNLSSHQIANIMNVTGEAIRKNRHRIRKKIGLDRTDSLEKYLSSF